MILIVFHYSHYLIFVLFNIITTLCQSLYSTMDSRQIVKEWSEHTIILVIPLDESLPSVSTWGHPPCPEGDSYTGLEGGVGGAEEELREL